MRYDQGPIRIVPGGFVLVVLAASLVACASVGPATPVLVTDVKSIAGTWKGIVYQSSRQPEYVELTIGDDGSYDVVFAQRVGASRGKGKITLSGGRLLLEGERGRGVATLLRNPAGDLLMQVDAVMSDNSIVSAKLSPSS